MRNLIGLLFLSGMVPLKYITAEARRYGIKEADFNALKGGLVMKFTKDMTVAQILRANSKTAEVFMRYGMHCLTCPGATGESVEQAAMVHGFNADEILEDLNKVNE